jgi:hypothetical protein
MYLYGIVRAGRPIRPGQTGVCEPPVLVESLEEGLVAAVISRVDSDQELSIIRDTRAHQRVLETVLRDGAVLPVSFGTVAGGEDSVRRLLRIRSGEWLRVLTDMDDKIEVGVKVFWEKEAVIKELAPRWGNIQELGKKAAKHDAEAARLGMNVGKAVVDLLEQWKNTHLAKATKSLEQGAVAARYNDTIGVRMLMNAAYLIKRDDMAAFEQTVYDIDRELGSRMRFHLVAPLPAYNFINVRLGPEEVEQLVRE